MPEGLPQRFWKSKKLQAHPGKDTGTSDLRLLAILHQQPECSKMNGKMGKSRAPLGLGRRKLLVPLQDGQTNWVGVEQTGLDLIFDSLAFFPQAIFKSTNPTVGHPPLLEACRPALVVEKLCLLLT
eukprot:EG_transcript_31184